MGSVGIACPQGSPKGETCGSKRGTKLKLHILQRSPDHWKVYQHGLFAGEIQIEDRPATYTPSSSAPPNLTLDDLHTLARFIRRRTRKPCTSHPKMASA